MSLSIFFAHGFAFSAVLSEFALIRLHTLQMTGISIDDWKLQLQANQIFQVSSRITRAMVEIALQSMQMQTCVSILKLEQAIETRCYPEFSTIWSQFDAIGQKHSTTLYGHVKTIQQFKTFDYFQIECLIGKATAQKLKESVAKLPIFVPQLVNVRFVDRHLVTQDCKWEIQIEIQRSHTPQECRVNILAGLWHGAVSVVKRHYLLQESGPANSIVFTVTTKSNERNIIIHLAVLSCTHAGIDREIIYKCAINSADARRPSAGRIDEINEKTLEVLAKKTKNESTVPKDSMEESQGIDRFHESQATQAKRKPKQTVAKDHDAMSIDEKQLSLLPNKALRTVATIKKKTVQQQLELTDDENELAFEEELFKQMDYPQLTEQNYTVLHCERKNEQQRHEAFSVTVERMQVQPNCVQSQNQGKSTPFHFERNFPMGLANQQMPHVEPTPPLRQYQSMIMERPSNQNEIQETFCFEKENPFASFAYKFTQSDSRILKDQKAIDKKTVATSFVKPCEQIETKIVSPKKITLDVPDVDRSLSAASQEIFALPQGSRFEGKQRHPGAFETIANSIHTKNVNEQKLPQHAGMVQVVSIHACTEQFCTFALWLTHLFSC